MVGALVSEVSGKGNGSSSILTQKRQRDDKRVSETLLGLNILDCPICYDALTIPTFQCDNGHLACSSCCPKLSNKCPSCSLPIGHSRCRAMERLVEAFIVPCPNAELGCTESFSYGKELTHEKECVFSQCSCPQPLCKYTGSYKDVYSHFDTHNSQGKQKVFGVFRDFKFGSGNSFKSGGIVLDDDENGLLFVAQFFKEPHGIYLAMSCIAPPALEVGEFSCHISTKEPYVMTFEFPKIKKTPKLISQFPEDDEFMLLPSYFFRERQALLLKISVRKIS